jgi:hypothetical protein
MYSNKIQLHSLNEHLCRYTCELKNIHTPTSGFELAYVIFTSTLSFCPTNSCMSKYRCPTEAQSSFSFSVEFSQTSSKSLTGKNIGVFAQQTSGINGCN